MNLNFEHTESEWKGFRRIDFLFEGREAILIFPEEGTANGKWVMKTEYFGAFEATELAFVKAGYHRAFIKNRSRWGAPEDPDVRARFTDFISTTFSLSPRFVAIGMSCGGLQAINFAGKYPDKVSLLYLDAPVLNLLSCPMGFGIGDDNTRWWRSELAPAYGMTSISELICYRDHPMDKLPVLVANRIPVAMVYGDVDTTVPYVENGKLLEDAYREAGIDLFLRCKPGCNHHPHGLEELDELLEYVEKNAL